MANYTDDENLSKIEDDILSRITEISKKRQLLDAPTPAQNAPFLGQQMPAQPNTQIAATPQINPAASQKMMAKQAQERILQKVNEPSAEKQIKEQQDLLQQLAALPVQQNYAPLAAFADYLAGGKGTASSGYQAPVSPIQRIQLQNQLQGELRKQQQGEGNTEAKLLGLLLKQTQAGGGVDQRWQNRIDNSIHQRTLSALRSDKPLKDRLTQYSNLDNSLKLITEATHITPQAIREFQQSVRSNLGIKGAGGVEERGETYFNDAGLNYENWKQFLTGNPADLAADKNFVPHLKELANIERRNIGDQMGTRIDALIAGNEEMYDRRQDLKHGLLNAVKASKAQFSNKPEKVEKRKVSSDEIKEYSKKHNLSEDASKDFLRKQGYGVD